MHLLIFVLSFSTYLHKRFGKSRVFCPRDRKYGSKNRGIRKIKVRKIPGNLEGFLKANPRDQGKSSKNRGIRIIACSKNWGSTVYPNLPTNLFIFANGKLIFCVGLLQTNVGFLWYEWSVWAISINPQCHDETKIK